jgi:hypothetical protein
MAILLPRRNEDLLGGRRAEALDGVGEAIEQGPCEGSLRSRSVKNGYNDVYFS